MALEQIASVVGAVGGIVGGVVMPFILYRMREAKADRLASFATLEKLLRHLDECLETKTESLRNQINGVHLEVAREYVTRPDLRNLEVDLRAEIDAARRLARIEDAVRSGL